MAKIMLVEDDNNLREIYGARLQAEGHKIVSAKDGEEALALAVKEKPELIIADIMMPKISGFDMLDILRNAPETKFTKVIMMTALSQAEDKARADKLGADKYLVKSQVTLEDVVAAVNEVLGDGEAGTSNPTTPYTPTPPSPAPAPQNPAPNPAPTPLNEPTQPASPAPSQSSPPNSIQTASPSPAPTPTSPTPPTPSNTNPGSPAPTSTPSPAPQATTSPLPPPPSSAIPVPNPNARQSVPKPTTKIEVVEAPEAPKASPQNPAPTPQPTTQPEPTQPINQDNPDDDTDSSLDENQPGQKKVIKPINDPFKKPDLDQLLAAEENKPPAQNPGASSIVTPTQPPTNSGTSTSPQKPDDPHSIAL